MNSISLGNLVGGDQFASHLPEFLSQFLLWALTGSKDNQGFDQLAQNLILFPHHRRFKHGFVFLRGLRFAVSRPTGPG